MSEGISKAALKHYLLHSPKISGSTYEQIIKDLELITPQTMTVTLKFDVADLDPLGDTYSMAVAKLGRYGVDLTLLDEEAEITVEILKSRV